MKEYRLHASEETTSLKKPATGPASPLLDTIIDTLEDRKAEEIVTIPLAGKSAIADHMVIATGRSGRQVAALADSVERAIRDHGLGRVRTEGLQQGDWVLLDAGDVIVHLFRPEVRSFYNLEKMWAGDEGDGAMTH